MQNGVERHDRDPGQPLLRWVKDAAASSLFAEGMIAQRRYVAAVYASQVHAARNAFDEVVGDEVTGDAGGASAAGAAELVERFAGAAAEGLRVALVAPAHELLAARAGLADIARRRLGTVVHLVASRSIADALAFADLGWGLLFASSLEDSFDLTLVARRAAEDSGTPFFVAHEAQAGVRHVESVGVASADLARVFVGPPGARLHREKDAAHPAHAVVGERGFVERVPFALSSAMRELESLVGRRHDLVERIPAMDTALVLVGLGEVGESLLAQTERLRDSGHDVGAVKITALRPFPGVRLIKALARAQAITVVEGVDEPLAQSNPLTRELKAAFADALTWAPGYPGVGRIPRIFSGFVGPESRQLDGADVETIVANMSGSDVERERRSFVLGRGRRRTGQGLESGGAAGDDGPLARGPVSLHLPTAGFALRVYVASPERGEAVADLCTQIIMGTLGLRTRATVRPAPLADGDEMVVDLFAARERPRGVHPPHAVRLLVMESAGSLLQGQPLARLGVRGSLAIPSQASSPQALWAALPAYAKAIVFDRHIRLFGYRALAEEPGAAADASVDASVDHWLHAALVAGVAVGTSGSPGRPVLDPSRLARDVEAVLLVALGPGGEASARRGGSVARAAMESILEVPRAVLEQDGDAIRLGRRDARAGDPPL